MTEPFKVIFSEKIEIRMGSPFNQCKVAFVGESFPTIDDFGFQDIYCWSEDYKYLALVKWNITDQNQPGFNIFVVDISATSQIFFSNRIDGVCVSLKLERTDILYTSLHSDHKSEAIIKNWKK